MILEYKLEHICGSHLSFVVQGNTRAECDEIVRKKTEQFNDAMSHLKCEFQLEEDGTHWVTVKDVSGDGLLAFDYYDPKGIM